MTKVRDLDQVLDAAARVFGEKGFEDARLEDIATELGILKGSLYYYATTKAELFFLVTRRRLTLLIAHAEAIAVSDAAAPEKMTQVVAAHLRQLDAFYPESRQWFTEPSRPRGRDDGLDQRRAEIQALNRRYRLVWRRIIADGVAAGVFRSDLDLDVATLGALGVCNWLTRWYDKDGRLTMEQISATLVPLIRGGLSDPGTPRLNGSGNGRVK
ncbi:MAG: TetR/AcrR family transcriptional regulator [Dehalococcoidia bacterium]